MKTIVASSVFLFTVTLCTQAALVARWDFNSPTPDGSTATGTLVPAAGRGTASALGGITNLFSAGDTAHDPVGSTDNSGWQTDHYPNATNANRSAGVQFAVDTSGYENLSLSWYERHSSTASRYTRLQYTLDGSTWLDADSMSLEVDSVFTNRTVDLSAVGGAANNPSFAFRLVTEFESTAIGGTNAYVATKTGSTYGTSGTIRFDLVSVSGTPIPGANTPPTISRIAEQTVRVGQPTALLPFTVQDTEDAPENLSVNATSSAPDIVPEDRIETYGTGTARTVKLTAGSQPGTATVTLWAIDSGGLSNSTSFAVTVLPLNTPPFLVGPPRTNTLADTPTAPLPITVGDLETSADELIVSAASANPGLVPNDFEHLSLGGSGSNRTVTVTPAPGHAGVAPITITVTDGLLTNSAVFPLMVTPSPEVIFYEPFDYPDGSLLTNSAFLWANRSGSNGQCQVTSRCLQVTAGQTEDVISPLIGGPYTRTNGTVLYASFKVRFLALPKSTPGHFAHFASGSTLRGRIYTVVTNAWDGGYRLGIANGSDTNTLLPYVLSTNTSYLLVERYDIDNASTKLWLSPAAESDPGVEAVDSQNPITISSYAFRQDSDIGATILIDDLRVGLTFAAVLPGATPNPIPLTIERADASVVLRWTNPAFVLQSAPAALGPFTNMPAASSPFTNPISRAPRFFRLKGP